MYLVYNTSYSEHIMLLSYKSYLNLVYMVTLSVVTLDVTLSLSELRISVGILNNIVFPCYDTLLR